MLKIIYIKSLIYFARLFHFITGVKESRLEPIICRKLTGIDYVLITKTSDGLKWKLPLGSYVDCKIALDALELNVLKFVHSLKIEKTIVVDMGANVGGVTLRLAKCVGKGGEVIAYEPNPETRGRLIENIKLNGFHNVTIIPKGVWSSEDSFDLLLPKHSNTGTASFLDKESNLGGEKVNVEVESFDQRWKSIGKKKVSLVKMDIQGAEEEAIKGMEEMLKACKPFVIMEVAGESQRFSQRISSVAQTFAACGYASCTLLKIKEASQKHFTIDEAIKGNWDHLSGDIVFSPNEKKE